MIFTFRASRQLYTAPEKFHLRLFAQRKPLIICSRPYIDQHTVHRSRAQREQSLIDSFLDSAGSRGNATSSICLFGTLPENDLTDPFALYASRTVTAFTIRGLSASKQSAVRIQGWLASGIETSHSRRVYECAEVNRSVPEFGGAARRTVEATEACVSPFILMRTLRGILTVFLPKDHHRARATVGG